MRTQRVLACIGDRSRFRVVTALVAGEYCVSDLAREVGLSQSCTTRHLQTLQREGLVSRVRQGKRVIFRLRDDEPEINGLLEWAMIRAPLTIEMGKPRAASRGRKTWEADSAGSPASGHAQTGGREGRAEPTGLGETPEEPAREPRHGERPASPTATAPVESDPDHGWRQPTDELEDFLL